MGYESFALLIVIVITVASVLYMLKRFQEDDGEHRDCGTDHDTGGTWHSEPTDATGCVPESVSDDAEPGTTGDGSRSADDGSSRGVATAGYPYARCRPCEEKTDWEGTRYYEDGEGGRVTEKTDWEGTRYFEDGEGHRVEEKTTWDGQRYFEDGEGHRVEEKTDWEGTRYYEDEQGNRVEEKTDWEGNRYFE